MRVALKSAGVLTVLLGLICAFLAHASLIPDPCGSAALAGAGGDACCSAEPVTSPVAHCETGPCADSACPDGAPAAGSSPCTTLCCGGLVATPEAPFALAYGIVPEILLTITECEPRTLSLDPLFRPPTRA